MSQFSESKTCQLRGIGLETLYQALATQGLAFKLIEKIAEEHQDEH